MINMLLGTEEHTIFNPTVCNFYLDTHSCQKYVLSLTELFSSDHKSL